MELLQWLGKWLVYVLTGLFMFWLIVIGAIAIWTSILGKPLEDPTPSERDDDHGPRW